MTRNHVPKICGVQVHLFALESMASCTTPCSLHLLIFRKPKQIEGMSSLFQEQNAPDVQSETARVAQQKLRTKISPQQEVKVMSWKL